MTRNSANRFPGNIEKLLPGIGWLRDYHRDTVFRDGTAAVIVTLMLIPQSLAYAMLAGLPPITGLYASILPLIAYSLLGTSATLSVGPVAVISLMTATALEPLFVAGSADYIAAAMTLAMLSGLTLAAMAALKLGFITNFLSHPVISGFISGSAILITIGQIKHILGIQADSHGPLNTLGTLLQNLGHTHFPTLLIGLGSLSLLILARFYFEGGLQRIGIPPRMATPLSKTGPVLVLILAIAVVSAFDLAAGGVAVVGHIQGGLPPLGMPRVDLDLVRQLLPAAVLISLLGFVESVSVGQTLAAKRRQRIDPNRELIGLGGANLAAAMSGGFPVTGGFSRSAVNFDAGAATPMAGIMTAGAIALTVLLFTPLFENLPQAVLAATIIVAVSGLVDISSMRHTWRYSRADALAMIATLAGVLLAGVEAGILLGIGLSLILFLKRTSRPHIAVVGQLPGSEHFRNIERHDVVTSPHVLSLRVDESLYFPNARYLEDRVAELVGSRPQARHLVLMCSAINQIDASALESLLTINERLRDAGVSFHLSEIKGPVMDRLQRSDFLQKLNGKIYVSQYEALKDLDPASAEQALAGKQPLRNQSARSEL